MKHIIRLATLAGLICAGAALAGPEDNTGSQYKPDTGQWNSGVVILQSDNGYNSEPINSAHPLPITGTVTSTPSGTQDTNLKQVNGTTATSGAGAVTAGTQRTTLASDDPAVTSLGVLDDWDESDRAKVNPIAGQAGVQGGSGAVTALTQRMTLATDVLLPATQPSASASAGIAIAPSAAVEAAKVLKASAGNLYEITVTNGATSGYVMLFNATSAPGDGAVTPDACYAMPATNTTLTKGFNPPAHFSIGITAVYSSTGCYSKTASATVMFMGMSQ